MQSDGVLPFKPPVSIVESTSAIARLSEAAAFVRRFPAGTEIAIAAASRLAADDFVRELARPHAAAATFGLRRFSLLQLAAFIATADLAERGLAPASALGVQAIATRATFEARRANGLAYVAPIADRPGFPAALCDTIVDLRAAGVGADRLTGADACLSDLSDLLGRFEEHLSTSGIADTATLLRLAASAVRQDRAPAIARVPLVLLDVPVENEAVFQFVEALVQRPARGLVTVASNDLRTLSWLRQLGDPVVLPAATVPSGAGQLARIQSRLFQIDLENVPDEPPGQSPPEVEFFSAPGEAREAIEIARRVLAEARAGEPFDRIAVLVRAPHVYGGLIETAFRRAGIPAWFARGTRRPDPAGRAFLAVLLCALERLSARRFAEYLSLGEVPDSPPHPRERPAARSMWVPADDELLRRPAALDEDRTPEADDDSTAAIDDDARPVVGGDLRTPWRWEELLVEAAVIGSRDRWERRLTGLAHDLDLRLRAEESDDPDSPRAAAIRRDLTNLSHLRDFALPVIDRLAALPKQARWGEWLEALDALAPMVLRRPDRVLAVLAELRPMAEVGAVALEEVHRVLAAHLSQLRHEPAAHRYGAVFVGTPEQVRGQAFDVVFVPGLAERVFPQRAREDPLLVDARRAELDARLPLRADITQKERLLLHLAVGAASRRLYLSYPSMELAQARARVPSFYAVDIERARTGRIPYFEVLARQAQRASGARLAWPAPSDANVAIDDSERDLAVIGRLLQLLKQDRAAARGRARFLLGLNPHLTRALRARWLRFQRQWSSADGLYNACAEARGCLPPHRLRARPYSVSALQRFAACPYQFLLGAVLRLAPRDEIAWLDQMDPLQRGEIFHRVQADVVRFIVRDGTAEASEALDSALDRVAAEYYEQLAPAIDRVWKSEIEAMRTDLHGWLQRLLDGMADWKPRHAELGFGFGPGDGRDAASIVSPVTLEGGWQLHGIVDLVERRADGEMLRVTDHKTGRAHTDENVVVGGGEALQPVLYGMALEIALGAPVEAGRLFYCTLAGGYKERPVPLDAAARRSGREVLEIIDRAVEQASLVPAPRERACQYCDFRTVCGPDEERRIARKDDRPLADLRYLRGLR